MNSPLLIHISQLRVGMYVRLDLGWMRHPFPVSNFRVSSEEQIAQLRELGLTEVRYVPEKSDPVFARGTDALAAQPPAPSTHETSRGEPLDSEAESRRAVLQEQSRILAACEQRFIHATQQYISIEQAVIEHPDQARACGEALVAESVSQLLQNGESVIRLLSEGVGERNALHPVNVMVVCLLLGRTLGMTSEQLRDLGIAALIHDLGKVALPPSFRQVPAFAPLADRKRYESHVGESVALAQRMGFSDVVLTAIAHHHEMADGSGFPAALSGAGIHRTAQVMALVNQYDRMCNPAVGTDALTPHEALAIIFAQLKSRFDPGVLAAFIRMMGVYPPGSVVQLVNDRYAIVVSVNSSRPLRPKVIVHDANVPKDQAQIMDLEARPDLGIRRSLKPIQLPRDALDYLSPRQRICYFFERAVAAGVQEADR